MFSHEYLTMQRKPLTHRATVFIATEQKTIPHFSWLSIREFIFTSWFFNFAYETEILFAGKTLADLPPGESYSKKSKLWINSLKIVLLHCSSLRPSLNELRRNKDYQECLTKSLFSALHVAIDHVHLTSRLTQICWQVLNEFARCLVY